MVGTMATDRRFRFVLVSCAAALTALVVATGALAAIGDLTAQGCIDDNDSGGDTCATTVDGLGGAQGVATSPDGKSVYVATFSDDSIVIFDRDPATGVLTYAGCIDDEDTGADTCTATSPGLDQPRGLAVSPDGRSVYVTAQIDDSVAIFNRDPATGALTPAGCIDDLPGEGPDTCSSSTAGMNGAIGVEVSPDGNSVYVTTSGDDAVVRFNRDAGGALTPVDCIDDEDSGADACAATSPGLNQAASFTISPDGKSVYVAAFGDDAVASFSRDTTSGALAPAGCIDDEDSGADTCATTAPGLDNPVGIASSSDGKSVYTAANTDDAVARFDRDTTNGTLTPAGCVDDNDSGADDCGATADGLDGLFEVVVSPGGGSVYTAANADNAVARFDRDPAGALIPNGCVDDNDVGADVCTADTDGLAGASGVAVSPDNRSLYAISVGDSAIVRFDREAEPVIVPPTTEPPGPTADVDPPETTITKKPKKKAKKVKVKVKFTSSEAGSTFECKLDKKAFKPCSSPFKKKKVKAGRKHKFLVRAKDAAGNVDATPAKAKWKVKKKR